jgi:hypothetical protein
VPVKRNRFIRLSGGTRSVNCELEQKARALAGLKGYVTNLRACPDGTPVTPEFVIGAYHQLFQIEKSFRMAKTDLQARPVYHRTGDSIEAHLTIVFAAVAVSRWIEARTSWSIRSSSRQLRYRTIEIQAGDHIITAADPPGTNSGRPPTAFTIQRVRTNLAPIGAPFRGLGVAGHARAGPAGRSVRRPGTRTGASVPGYEGRLTQLGTGGEVRVPVIPVPIPEGSAATTMMSPAGTPQAFTVSDLSETATLIIFPFAGGTAGPDSEVMLGQPGRTGTPTISSPSWRSLALACDIPAAW